MKYILKTDGTKEDLEGTDLKSLQKAVGGYIEVVSGQLIDPWNGLKYLEGHTMIANEEGLIHNLPYNDLASIMAQRHIVGDVVIIESEELK